MTSAIISLVVVLGVVAIVCLLRERGFKFIGLAPHQVHFPGPSALPFFGNLLELRNGHVRTLAQWGDTFGPIIRIVIGDRETFNAR
ncbi:hypothetical protein PENSPDRAFT_686249 [Peniophora sp. CONT]|nr:hypothetical protein PENSPDRAFT_686249 [Peniophora sp. CONT]